MKTFEVRIRYEGTSTFMVQAEDAKAAEKLAENRYMNGEEGELTGSESEEITSIDATIVEGA